MKFIDTTNDEQIEGFKMPYKRPVNCPAYESDADCGFYGHSWTLEWEGSICTHPKAEGNKRGWLITCPKVVHNG